MIIFPAIDLKDGVCVRLYQGKMDLATVYSRDPQAIARNWAEQGAKWLHVVDLNGAIEGAYVNLEAVSAITSAVTIPVQYGGGVRSKEALDAIFAAGVTRAVIGTAFIADPMFAAEALKAFGDKIVFGLDSRDGMVAVKGWVDVTEIPLLKAAQDAETLGASRLICTDISTDGAMTGPSLPMFKELVDNLNISVIASGGISRIEDIRRLRIVTGDRLEGAIIGRALYEKAFTLAEAIKAGTEDVD